ncbi:hypothetical protein [Paenibacillus sp. HB172176]|uniref:hypothetical protein n=1 Tax=Paenibacillus sp. HB172176 TaxID=2493690 RepID=UPI00143AEB0A|nr:hypothetical protein [Paenibacillus sp. HB172176]
MQTEKNRGVRLIVIGLIVFLFGMVKTTPSYDTIHQWMMKKNGIVCEPDFELGNICYKDGEKIISKSAHFQNAAIYATYEKDYAFKNGEETTFRTFGILGLLFRMEDGFWWRIID